jgi:gluconolactonase
MRKLLHVGLQAVSMSLAAVPGVSAQSGEFAGELSAICGECRLEKFASCGEGKFLEGPNFDAAGNLWMVGLRSGEILKVTPAGECSVAGKSGGFPGGARFDHEGTLLISDRIGLLAYDTAAGTVEPIRDRYGNQNMRGLNDVVVDKGGGIYFTEPYGSNAVQPTGRVFYLPPDRKKDLVLIGDTFAFPNGVMLSPDETVLYVGEYAINRVTAIPMSGSGVVNAAGVPFVFAYMTGGIGPDGMAVDVDGNLYVAHYKAGEVVIYNPSGFPIGYIRMPADAGQWVTNVALHGGYLYITEANKNEVWRVKTNVAGHMPKPE